MPRFDVFYMRGDFVANRPEMADVVRDAKAVLDVSPEDLLNLSADLQSHSGFLDQTTLFEITRNRISDQEKAKKIAGFVGRMSRLKITASDLLASIAEWRSEPDNVGGDLLTEVELAGLRDRIPTLVKNYDGLTRQSKAERLASATGMRLESVETVSDLRPVYDDKQEQVVGVIPLTTLRVVYNGVAGFPSSVEIALTEAQVEELAKKMNQAAKKLQVLKKLASEIQKPIPVLPATIPTLPAVTEAGN